MKEVRNADDKRVCDISDDGKTMVIERKGFKTIVTANSDGTLNIQHEPKAA